ncbi:hypothetical protein OPV22_019520 [Ensete ventricosum]|uniref:Uncharacterized protein n=1 Tax=Ensete ventricosum TaxID=4639 RepID=A0AAV8QI04_ENSVE|nr:hypothetical protein OPV22_019520 [Ensete ventricosum]
MEWERRHQDSLRLPDQLIHPTCRILIAGEMDKVIFFFLGGETKPEDKVVRALPLLLNLPAVLGGADRVFTVSISRLLPLPFISSESDKPIHRNHPSMLLLDNEKCLNHSERAQEDEQFLLPWSSKEKLLQTSSISINVRRPSIRRFASEIPPAEEVGISRIATGASIEVPIVEAWTFPPEVELYQFIQIPDLEHIVSFHL